MWCDFQSTDTDGVVWCQRCRTNAYAPIAGIRLRRICKANAEPQESGDIHRPSTGAGSRLTQLISFIGQEYSDQCGCESEAQKMNAGTTTIDQTIAVMRNEAEKRSVPFFESQAKWLIELAYTLHRENRDPVFSERVRLRLMRRGVRLLTARQPSDESQQSP